MKVIDLLNKIANGEEVPKKVKYKNKIYEWKEYDVCYGKIMTKKGWVKENGYVAEENRTYFYLKHCYQDLNDEVEILEEEPRDIELCGSLFTKSEYDKLARSEEEKKIPEKLSTWYSVLVTQNDEDNIEYANYNFSTMYGKINEIIDYLEYLKNKGE